MSTISQNIKTSQRPKFIDKIPCWLKNINSLFYYYLFLVLVGLVFFSASLFINYFTTPFTGDYSTQQFSFYTNGYDDWWHFFKTGEFVYYDTNTFLGVNNIGSNSFYYLFDPFFIPILLFPRQLIPQGMAILTIFKMALSGLTFYAYMRILGASRRASKITGLAYAFSGWITWYLWFNHFTGVAVAFPLLLLGVELLLRKKNPIILIGSICLIGFINFFFMFCYVVCSIFYAIFRYFQTLKNRNKIDNIIILLLLNFSLIVGVMMPMMVVLPSALYSITSPRASNNGYFHYLVNALKTNNLKYLFDLLTNWSAITNNSMGKARKLYPFIEFIFPVASCRGTPLTIYNGDTYDNVAGSFYCFIPMLLLLFPAFKSSLKQKHFSVLIPLVFFVVALFTPCFYYLFFGFTAAYSRWTLFVVTSIMAYSGKYLDKIKQEDNKIVLIESAAILIILVLIGGLAAQTIVTTYGDYFKERLPIWLACILEIIYICILTTTLFIIKNKQKFGFYWIFTTFMTFEISLMGVMVINGHGVENYTFTNNGFVKNDILKQLVQKTAKKDPSYYRSYSSLADEKAPNDELRNNYNGLSTFHSLYNYNTADFCNLSSIFNGTAPMSWSGTYVQKRINVDTLLGVKYYYVEDDYFVKQNRSKCSSDQFRYNLPFNTFDVSQEYENNYFKIFKNMDYIDFALTYDSYYVYEGNPAEKISYSGLNENSRNILLNEELYLQAALINKTRETNLISDIENSHPNLHKLPKDLRHTNDYYYNLSIGRYGNVSSAHDSVITFYDFFSAGEKTLTVDACTYLSLANVNEKYEKVSYPKDFSKDQRYVAVIESKDSYFPNYDPKGNVFYITASFEDGYETDIYLVDIENKIVTFDSHNDESVSSNIKGKEERAFYTSPVYDSSFGIVKDAPKIKKIILVSRSNKVNTNPYVSIDTFNSYKTKILPFKNYPVTNVTNSTNSFSFNTDFDEERIVVTRLAYEDGFKLTMKDSSGNKKDLKVFNAQGGFVSFISGVGSCSYDLQYITPNLKKGSLISSLGVSLYIASLISFVYLDMRRKEKELLEFK